MNKKKSILLTLLGLFWILCPLLIIFFKSFSISIIFFFITFILQIIYLLRYNLKNFMLIYIKFKENFYDQPITSFFNNNIKKIPGIGDFLIYFCKLFFKLYKSLGKYSIRISVFIFFIIPNIILIILIFLRIFFSYNIAANAFIFIILLIRLIKTVFFVLCDFCLQNRIALEKYLIITKVSEKTYSYKFNNRPIINKTQETLNLYTSRHILFEETHSFMQSTVDYKNNIIKPWLNPIMLSTLLTSNLKVIFVYFTQSFNLCFFIILFLVILAIEKFNIYKENVT